MLTKLNLRPDVIKHKDILNERNTMDKRELLEIGTVGSVGAAGVTLPNLQEYAEFFNGITPIASFFLILVPTGIWAWCRAIQYLKEKRED